MPWYRGDLHVHTARSHNAELTPEQVVRAARAAGLDFIATTEHDTVDGHGDWAPYAGELLVIPGMEVTTPDGHWLAVGLPPGRRITDVDDVRRAGGLCIAAHPHAPYPTGRLTLPLARFDAVEVWNGQWSSDLPWQADNEAALAQWSRQLGSPRSLPAVGNSDAHLDGQLGTPQTAVWAASLTVDAVLGGIRAGRCRVTGSAAVTLSVTMSGSAVQVAVTGVRSGTVRLHTARGIVHEAPSDSEVSFEPAGPVWVSVRDAAGSIVAVSNPVFPAPDGRP